MIRFLAGVAGSLAALFAVATVALTYAAIWAADPHNHLENSAAVSGVLAIFVGVGSIGIWLEAAA